jgi:carboxylesterase type B
MQSGSAHITPGVPKGAAKGAAPAPAPAVPQFIRFADSLGCSDAKAALECMRKLPATTIKAAIARRSYSFGAVEDGDFTVMKDAEKARREKRVANVPLLIGTNADEQRSSMGGMRSTSLKQYLDQTYPNDAELKEQLAKAYAVGPTSHYRTDFEALTAIATDLAMTCVTSRESKVSAEAGYRKCSMEWVEKSADV